MKTTITFFATLLLAGCAAMAPSNLIRATGEPDFATEGLVALKFHGDGNGSFLSYKPNHPMQLIIRKVNSQEYAFTNVSNKRHAVLRLPAGEYYLAGATANDMLIITKFDSDAYEMDKALPFKPFSVIAGEAVYLGNIKLSGVRYEQRISGESDNISYTFTNDFAEAKPIVEALISEYIPTFKGTLQEQVLEGI